MNLYVSSVAYSGLSFDDAVIRAKANQIPLEFSSGMPPQQNATQQFLDYPYTKLAHNYFPAALQDPFVINLGSPDPAIRQRSIEHCELGLKISAQAAAPFFAAHAGFAIDPHPDELGKPLRLPDSLPDMNACQNRFLDAVDHLLDVAERHEIDFYIENNVIAPFNLVGGQSGGNPLLGCTAAELHSWQKHFEQRRFGILLDTAHLKVSAKSLGLNLMDEAEVLSQFIAAIHHSDNDGTVDNNQPLPADYWFAPYMPKLKQLPQVLEVRKLTDKDIEAQLALVRNFSHLKDIDHATT